jgi:hypothetical protein
MANSEHLEILKRGVEQWNIWRQRNSGLAPDLSEVDISRQDLSNANLYRTNLSKSNLSEARLGGAILRMANLVDANLSHAELRSTDFGGALLVGADFRGAYMRETRLTGACLVGAHLNAADLGGATFTGAELSGADFTQASAWETEFADVDLRFAKGLDTVRHQRPSTIGIDTIYKSGGKIPEVFLRGCGVPDEFIAYIGSMVGRPIGFYSCFISYSTKDQEFAERLHADLQAKGVRCWFAPEEMKGGRKLHEQIDEAIRLHDKLLLILSEHSMSSEWVKTEIANAREREKREGKQLLFPITLVPFEAIKQWKLFNADIGVDSAREIREYFIPDFSNWKDHDSYQAALQRLVKDLKAGGSG